MKRQSFTHAERAIRRAMEKASYGDIEVCKNRNEHVTTYVICAFGKNWDELGEVDMYVQPGIVTLEDNEKVTIWRAIDAGRELEWWFATREEAVTCAEEVAVDEDASPDMEEIIAAIIETGYFGDADSDDIRDICHEATRHSQGYLLLPRGSFVGHPIGRMWTTNGYLQCDHISLDATHGRIDLAAAELLHITKLATCKSKSENMIRASGNNHYGYCPGDDSGTIGIERPI